MAVDTSELKTPRLRPARAILRGGAYDAVDLGRKELRGWHPRRISPNGALEGDLHKLRDFSRDLWRNSNICNGAIKTMRTSVVGSGLKAYPAVNYKWLGLDRNAATEWEQDAYHKWQTWATNPERCDAARQSTFVEMQALALYGALVDGDAFALLPVLSRNGGAPELRISLRGGAYVDTPETKAFDDSVHSGIELDEWGGPVAYWFRDSHPYDTTTIAAGWTRVPARGAKTGRRLVLHLFDRTEIGQVRGEPLLARAIVLVKQLARYTDAEAMAAVLNAFLAIFIQREKSDDLGGRPPIGYGDGADAAAPGGSDLTVDMANGAVVDLDQGETVQSVAPGRPNPNYQTFVDALLREIGLGIGIPFEVLVKKFDSSYSASRAARLDANHTFTQWKTWLATSFCQPVYEEWLAGAVSRGEISAPGFFDDPAARAAWCSCKWVGDSFGSIDPQKEAQAFKTLIEEGLMTREQATIELNGGDLDDNARQLAHEYELFDSLGVPLGGEPQQNAADDSQKGNA